MLVDCHKVQTLYLNTPNLHQLPTAIVIVTDPPLGYHCFSRPKCCERVHHQPVRISPPATSVPFSALISSMDEIKTKKRIHSVILDAGPLLLNEPPLSVLRAKCEEIFTVPAVLGEIRDASARQRLETTVLPFLTVRDPEQDSVRFMTDFARQSGDSVALSKTDLDVLALAYELECEKNHGDWRLKRTPGQRGLNGRPPIAADETGAEVSMLALGSSPSAQTSDEAISATENSRLVQPRDLHADMQPSQEPGTGDQTNAESPRRCDNGPQLLTAASILQQKSLSDVETALAGLHCSEQSSAHGPDPGLNLNTGPEEGTSPKVPAEDAPPSTVSTLDGESSSSESDGWITPSNIHCHRVSRRSEPAASDSQPTLQVATLTTDYALQNVLLLSNLNLLSAASALAPIKNLRTTMLRCHACFLVVPPKRSAPASGFAGSSAQDRPQFCPRCGLANTLTRVTTTTDAATGVRKLHLKKNMQWSHRGDRYSMPKPVAGSSAGTGKRQSGAGGKGSAGRQKGCGGKGGWGTGLLLAEDQKEYVRAVQEADRSRRGRIEKDEGWDANEIFNTARRGAGSSGSIKVGVRRDVNSRSGR